MAPTPCLEGYRRAGIQERFPYRACIHLCPHRSHLPHPVLGKQGSQTVKSSELLTTVVADVFDRKKELEDRLDNGSTNNSDAAEGVVVSM